MVPTAVELILFLFSFLPFLPFPSLSFLSFPLLPMFCCFSLHEIEKRFFVVHSQVVILSFCLSILCYFSLDSFSTPGSHFFLALLVVYISSPPPSPSFPISLSLSFISYLSLSPSFLSLSPFRILFSDTNFVRSSFPSHSLYSTVKQIIDKNS